MKEKTARQIAVESARYLMMHRDGEVVLEMAEKTRANVIHFMSVIGDYLGAKFKTRVTTNGAFKITRVR